MGIEKRIKELYEILKGYEDGRLTKYQISHIIETNKKKKYEEEKGKKGIDPRRENL